MRSSILLFSILLLTGCANAPLDAGCERFGHHGAVCLLPPAALPAVDGARLVTVTHDGEEQSFVGMLHVDSQDLRLVGLSLFGTALFSLSYDGRAVTVQPASAASDWHPERLVVMLELALADPASLQPRLKGLKLKTDTQGGMETRDLYEDGELISHLERSTGSLPDATLRIDLPPAKFSVTMKPMPVQSAPP